MIPIKKENLIELLKNENRMTCVFFRDDGFISDAVIECQNIYWDGTSQYSHIGFIGSDKKFYESTVSIKTINIEKKFLGIKLKIPQLKFVYGIKVSSLDDRLNDWCKYKRFGVQNLPTITSEQWRDITAIGQKMYEQHFKYGGFELFGTLWTLIKWKLTRDPEKRKKILIANNPCDDPKAIYCIAFVATCITNSTGLDYVSGVSIEQSTVDHGVATNLVQIFNEYKCEN